MLYYSYILEPPSKKLLILLWSFPFFNSLGIMENLWFDITRELKDLYYFSSNKVQCLEMIKYIVVRVVQISLKFLMMDMVSIDLSPIY